MTILDNFPHECTISRPEYVVDSLGADIPVFQQVAAGVKCWAQNATQQEVNEFQKRDQTVTHKVMFTDDQPLKVGDIITMTKAESGILGKVMRFQDFTDRSAGLGIVYRAMCEEEKNPRYAELIPS